MALLRDSIRHDIDLADDLDFAGILVVVLDRDGRVSELNRSAGDLLGRRPADAVGEDWFRFVPTASREEVRAVFRRIVAGDLDPVEWFENEILAGDGTVRTIAWRNRVLRDGDGRITGTMSAGTETTERNRLARELCEKENLARLGEMTATVAHEVRNPLAGIAACLRTVADDLPPGGPHAPVLDEIQLRLRDLRAVVDDMLVCARPLHPRLAPVRLVELLEETAALTRSTPELAGATLRVEGDELEIPADRRLLRHVFLNLFRNAAEAVEGAGTVVASVERQDAWCRVTVRDDGPGVPPEIRERAFEPFVTTKGHGTGLGLATARRVVEAHGGDIGIRCPPEGGTCVVLALPVA